MNVNTPKWVPKHSSDISKLFTKSREVELQLRLLARRLTTDINLDLLDCYEFQEILEESKKCLLLSDELQNKFKTQLTPATSKKIKRSPYKILIQRKALIMTENLQKKHYQLIFVINKTIKSLLEMSSQSELIMNFALHLCNLFNEFVKISQQSEQLSFGANICSNTFPSLLLQPKKIDIGIILQIVCKSRCEQCCHALISCLLTTCKLQLVPTGGDADSDTSSIEILRALTSHLTSPAEKDRFCRQQENRVESPDCDTQPQDPAIKFFDNMANELLEKRKTRIGSDGLSIKEELLDHLISEEENFVANIILKCFKLCQSAFDCSSMNSQEVHKWINRGSRSLWTQIGSTLDHIVLWWSEAPLACRPVVCSKQLKQWLMNLSEDDAPEPILSTLKGLGETLTTHITNTMWDQQFRVALVSSTLHPDVSVEKNFSLKVDHPGTKTGELWCEVLSNLTMLCNTCDQNGTIPNQLPIVEQIPILHRMDHSIHSMRLWALAKAKSLCSEWNMSTFFKIVNGDINNCLEQLQYLRVPQLVPADPLEVLIQVCVALRSKLVSEIKANIMKLKQTNAECIEILSSTCRVFTLATLSLCLPPPRQWQVETLQEDCGEYVTYFLGEIYLPVVKATQDVEILGLILKIICEAWLDHIYQKRVKFSKCGAINLLKDFDGVAEWIRKCPAIPPECVDKLSKHEVLRMCEGVGKILLRKPDEVVSIVSTPKYSKKTDEDEPEDKAKLPPEMFVPNQKRWLELRARNRRVFSCMCLCAEVAVENN